MTKDTVSSPPVPAQLSPMTLFAPLGGTFFLRAGGGVMGILTGLFLNAKNVEMGSPTHPFFISATLAGLIIASFYLTELGGSFIAGNFIDRHGPRRYMIVGPLFGAVAMVITALLHLSPDSPAPQFILFIGLMIGTRLLEGTAAATANPASLAYIAAYTSGNPKLRSRISGYFELATLIGATFGFVIGGVLWDKFGQTAFLLNAGVYLLGALIFRSAYPFHTPSGEHAEAHDLKQYRKLMGSARLRELIPAWLAIAAILGVLFNHSTFQLSAEVGKGLHEFGDKAFILFPDQTLSHAFRGTAVGIVFGMYGVAFGIGILIWSRVLAHMRKSTAMLISGGGVIAASILIALVNHTGAIGDSNPWRVVLLPLTFIAVMIESGFTPAALIYLSDLSELHPANRGMVMGLYSFLLGFGQLAGTIAAGPFADWRGLDGLLLFMAILGVVSMFSVTLLRRDEESLHVGLGPDTSPGAAPSA